MSNNQISMPNQNEQISTELFKYINNIRHSNQLNIFTRDKMSEHVLSTIFRGKKEPPSNNDIEAKFVSRGCVFINKIIHRLSVAINNNPSYQVYLSIIQQELSSNKNTPLLSNKLYSHMGLSIKNFETNFYIIFVFSTKLISFDRVIGCNDGNILEGTWLNGMKQGEFIFKDCNGNSFIRKYDKDILMEEKKDGLFSSIFGKIISFIH